MKGFLIGLMSTVAMSTLLYVTALNPSSLLVSQLNTETVEPKVENSKENEERETFTSEEFSMIKGSYQEHLEQGDRLFEKKYYALAAEEYEEATKINSQGTEGFQKLGEAYFQDKNFSKALGAFTEATGKTTHPLESDIYLGKTWIALGDFTSAENHFASLASQDNAILYYQGVLKAYNENFTEAKTAFEQIISKNVQDEWTLKAENYLNSMKEYEGAQDPNLNYIKTLMGRSFSETQEYNLAINTLFDVIQEEPAYRDAWIIMGYAYLQQEKNTEAQDALLKAIELDPTKAESRYFLGLTYFGQKEYESSVAQFELALESGFEPANDLYKKIADSSVEIKNFPKAIEAYEKLLLLDSSQVEFYIRPIWIYLDHLNNSKKAIQLAEEAIKNHPNEALAYNLLGWAQIAADKWEEAEENLNYALVLDPQLAAAHLNFGVLYEKKGNLEEAKTHYKRAYNLDPEGSIGNRAAENYNRLISQESVTPLNPSSL